MAEGKRTEGKMAKRKRGEGKRLFKVFDNSVTVELYYCLVISTGANFLGLFQLCIFCLEF